MVLPAEVPVLLPVLVLEGVLRSVERVPDGDTGDYGPGVCPRDVRVPKRGQRLPGNHWSW